MKLKDFLQNYSLLHYFHHIIYRIHMYIYFIFLSVLQFTNRFLGLPRNVELFIECTAKINDLIWKNTNQYLKYLRASLDSLKSANPDAYAKCGSKFNEIVNGVVPPRKMKKYRYSFDSHMRLNEDLLQVLHNCADSLSASATLNTHHNLAVFWGRTP